MINKEAVFPVKKYTPPRVVILVTETQQKIEVLPCSNGWWYGANNFVHKSKAKLVKVLENEI